MTRLNADDPRAVAVVAAIQAGDQGTLRAWLAANPELASAIIVTGEGGEGREGRSLAHIATDWPGGRPEVARTLTQLHAAGADLDARFVGAHRETPLHWAASANDVQAVAALLDLGAALSPDGGVLGGGPPLQNAIGFGQWQAARLLVERGAPTGLGDEAALGLLDRLHQRLAPDGSGEEQPSAALLGYGLWNACFGGQLAAAQLLLAHGAPIDWVAPWSGQSPLGVAQEAGHADVVAWLRSAGARPAG